MTEALIVSEDWVRVAVSAGIVVVLFAIFMHLRWKRRKSVRRGQTRGQHGKPTHRACSEGYGTYSSGTYDAGCGGSSCSDGGGGGD